MKKENRGKMIGRMLPGLIFSLACMANGGEAKAEIDLAKATIVVGQKASAPEMFAAEELAKYVEKMSGAKLAIAKENDEVNGNAVLIGTLKNNGSLKEIAGKEKIEKGKLDKDHDGFIVRTYEDKLLLIGSNPRSVLFGVYALLERFGCLWPAPGEDCVPQLKNLLAGDLDIEEKADCDYRMTYTGGRYCFEEMPAFLDWLAKNRSNYLYADCAVGGTFKLESIRKYRSDIRRRGFSVAFGSDGAVTYFLPWSKYGKEHPEYFALFKGKRIPHQVCVSNPDVVRLEAENIVKFVRENPEVDVIDFCPGDGCDWCECEKCMAKDSPIIPIGKEYHNVCNSYIEFENEVLNEVNKTHPSLKFFHQCYAGYTSPPRITLKNLSKNLYPIFGSTNARCVIHPLWGLMDKECPCNQNICSSIEGWIEWYGSDRKRMIIFNSSSGGIQWTPMPFPTLNILAKDFPHIKELGGVGIWHGVKIYRLNNYVSMRLAWKADESLDKILTDYCDKYYGASGKHIRDYYLKWEKIAPLMKSLYYGGPGKEITEWLSDNDVSEFKDYFAGAEKASESAEMTGRIKALSDNFNYVKLVREATITKNEALKCNKAGNREQAQKAREETLRTCEKIVDMNLNPEFMAGRILTQMASGLAMPYKGFRETAHEPDEHTVLLAHFNKTLDADYAKGNKEHAGEGTLTQNNGGRFGEGVKILKGGKIVYKAEAGIGLSEGAVEFWIKPDWNGADADLVDSRNIFSSGKVTVFTWNHQLCVNSPNWNELNAPIRDWEKGEWHHLAVTWKGRERHLYVDGKEAACALTTPLSGTVREFTFFDCDATLDELVIRDVQ